MSKGAWTTADIPDQSGRIAVVTGANTGLGFETAAALASHGARVVLAVRDVGKGERARTQIVERAAKAHVQVQKLDLGSLASVREAAGALKAVLPKIDLLINNAGLMYPPKGTTEDGFELQFGTNHLGHFALTGLLLDKLEGVPGSRIVTVSSLGHKIRAAIHFDDLQWERSYSRLGAYGQSKLANLLFTYELQRRLTAKGARTEALAAHPGGSATELTRNSPAWFRVGGDFLAKYLFNSAAQGALPTLRAATDPAAKGGQYYGPDGFGEASGDPKIVGSSAQSHDQALQSRLWRVSEELTGISYLD